MSRVNHFGGSHIMHNSTDWCCSQVMSPPFISCSTDAMGRLLLMSASPIATHTDMTLLVLCSFVTR